VLLIGIEDLILDRLNGYTFAKSTDDLHWAAELLVMYRDRLDLEYLQTTARDDRVSDGLRTILDQLGSA
jgi:hypothetical protein